MKNFTLSRELADVLDCEQNKECWFNCQRAIRRVKELHNAIYVEGFAAFHNDFPLAVEHAWLTLDGEIIDPTLPDDGPDYIAGLSWSGRQQVIEFDRASVKDRRRRKGSPFFYAFGWGGANSTEFTKARKDAYHLVYGHPI